VSKKGGLRGVDALFGPRPVEEARPAPDLGEQRVRTSVYLAPEDVVILDQLQTLEFQKEKRRPDRSELMRKALRFYHKSVTGG
jgi:hypothetical protein